MHILKVGSSDMSRVMDTTLHHMQLNRINVVYKFAQHVNKIVSQKEISTHKHKDRSNGEGNFVFYVKRLEKKTLIYYSIPSEWFDKSTWWQLKK